MERCLSQYHRNCIMSHLTVRGEKSKSCTKRYVTVLAVSKFQSNKSEDKYLSPLSQTINIITPESNSLESFTAA